MSQYLLSFDVEDWFHSHNLRQAIARDSWDDQEFRVADNVSRLLDMLDEHDARATFFVLGWVAERAPEMVEEIVARGHEIASHGYGHELLYELSRDEAREDIKRSVAILEDLSGQRIRGYRAPSFSITDWGADILADAGFEYDSSLFRATAHDRYGSMSLDADSTFARLDNGLVEAQLPVVSLPGFNVPWAGGAYFRLIPYPIYRRGVKHATGDQPFIFYFHPWEIDTGQPKLRELSLNYRLRHYTNVEKTETRLNRLFSEFDWEPIEAGMA